MTFTREEVLAARGESCQVGEGRRSETSPRYPPRRDYREWWISDGEWTRLVCVLWRILEERRAQ